MTLTLSLSSQGDVYCMSADHGGAAGGGGGGGGSDSKTDSKTALTYL
jgi:hypothetical protein